MFRIKVELYTILVLIILSVGITAASAIFTGYDDTDDQENGVRSGLQLYTDYGTGCQYIKAGFFGELTKRVDGNGNHVGCH